MKGRHFTSTMTVIAGALIVAGCASATTLAWNAHGSEARSGLAIGTPAARHLGYGAQQAQPAETPAATASLPQDDTQICRAIAGPTGSRLGVRSICMTQVEWQAKTQNDRDQLEDASSRALSTQTYGQD